MISVSSTTTSITGSPVNSYSGSGDGKPLKTIKTAPFLSDKEKRQATVFPTLVLQSPDISIDFIDLNGVNIEFKIEKEKEKDKERKKEKENDGRGKSPKNHRTYSSSSDRKHKSQY